MTIDSSYIYYANLLDGLLAQVTYVYFVQFNADTAELRERWYDTSC